MDIVQRAAAWRHAMQGWIGDPGRVQVLQATLESRERERVVITSLPQLRDAPGGFFDALKAAHLGLKPHDPWSLYLFHQALLAVEKAGIPDYEQVIEACENLVPEEWGPLLDWLYSKWQRGAFVDDILGEAGQWESGFDSRRLLHHACQRELQKIVRALFEFTGTPVSQ